jgi:hypothetical protein
VGMVQLRSLLLGKFAKLHCIPRTQVPINSYCTQPDTHSLLPSGLTSCLCHYCPLDSHLHWSWLWSFHLCNTNKPFPHRGPLYCVEQCIPNSNKQSHASHASQKR